MITSTSNSQVKYVMSLQNKSRFRKEKKEFVAEGLRMVLEAPRDRIVKVYASEAFEKSNPDTAAALRGSCVYEAVGDNVFAQMSDTQSPQGIMAVVSMEEYQVDDLFGADGNAFILAVENLQDPGNLGTIVRTAEGAGVTGILLSGGCVDIYNPKTIRSTMGSLFRLPIVHEQEFLNALEYLKEKQVTLFAAHLEGKTIYTQADYKTSCGFLIGNENSGLSESAAKKCDMLIKIPMSGTVESLNASVAAAILMYEAKRQKNL